MNMGSSFFFQDVIFIWTLASKTTLLVGEDKKNIIYQGYFFLTKSQKFFTKVLTFLWESFFRVNLSLQVSSYEDFFQ